MKRLFAVLSGLPASGKTTVARPLAAELGLPLLDKDDILESLFDGLGVSTTEERFRLSRASDRVLQAVATTAQGAVLTSFWRRESLSKTSGTPVQWLRDLPGAAVVEVFCECPPRLAAERYAARQRHPGHFDLARTTAELLCQFEQLDALGPVGLGPVLRIDTTNAFDVVDLARSIRRAAV